jgi:endothelin-converting enzyme
MDPCEEFYEMVCGGWEGRHDLRPDQDGIDTPTIMIGTAFATVRHILEADYPRKSNV